MSESCSEAARFAELETGLLVLEASSLWLAAKRGDGPLWLGFALFGLLLESAGVGLGTHVHSQFSLQALPILPLKELLFYPLSLYSSFAAVRALGLSSLWAQAVAMSLMQHLANCPYDVLGAKPDAGYWTLNAESALANFGSDLGGVLYSWLVTGAVVGLGAATCERWRLGPAPTVVVVGFSLLLSPPLWAPFHTAKFLGCAAQAFEGGAQAKAGLADYARAAAAGDVAALWDAHAVCIRASPVSDSSCWAAGLVLVLLLMVAALASEPAQPGRAPGSGPKSSSKSKPRISRDDSDVVALVVGFHTLMTLLYWRIAPDQAPKAAAFGAFAVIVHAACHHSSTSRSFS